MDKLFCLGNPLLDVSANVDQAFLDKYGVKLNNAILAEEQHLPVFEDLVQNHNPLFIAGGATQNTARVAQWQVNQPGAVTYAGAIGKDKFGEELKKATQADSLTTLYYEVDGSATGTCAVLVVDKERSLIANLGAAEKYKIEWTQSASVQKAISEAKIFYIAGFVMTHSADSIMHIAKHACENNKVFTMNMAAPFLFQVPPFLAAFKEVWEYLDMVFGNESEAAVVSEAFQLGTTDVKEIAQKLAQMPKKNSSRPRTVIITQGDAPTIVATPDSVHEFPVPKVANLVDTNGAGDAFCGGFLAMMIQQKPIEEAVNTGHYTAGIVIQRSGCQFSDAKRCGEQ
jgi:adenosine kinase